MIAVSVFTAVVGWACGMAPSLCSPETAERDRLPYELRVVSVEPDLRRGVFHWRDSEPGVVVLSRPGLRAVLVEFPGDEHYLFVTRESDAIDELDRFVRRLPAR